MASSVVAASAAVVVLRPPKAMRLATWEYTTNGMARRGWGKVGGGQG